VGEGEYFIASDASPFIEYTSNAIYLDDGEMANIRLHKPMKVRKIKDDSIVDPYIQELQMNLEQIEKGGYDHFMLKEIYEQPNVIKDTYRGRLHANEGLIQMAGVEDNLEKFLNADRIIIIACGTSWHAGLVAEYVFEEFTRIPVEVEYASEFRYRNPIIGKKDVVIAISQSGETADTMAAIKLAKENGAFVFGVCNVVGSSISRESHAGAYTHAGPEIGVASTKAFTTQLVGLYLLALTLAKHRKLLTASQEKTAFNRLRHLPSAINAALALEPQIIAWSEAFAKCENALFLGRGLHYPIALEGALKLKEISYIHAEAYPAGELKHGPLALVTDKMPVVTVAPNDALLEKLKSNMQEVKARGGRLYVFADSDTQITASEGIHVIRMPENYGDLSPILHVIPLQLLAYHTACAIGTDVDKPRNLAKSVTVE
jgi:glucosamine--fructose-6-phosphate aminotransferase (isomerizing)